VETNTENVVFGKFHDLDLISGHMAYRRASPSSLIDLYLHAKFHLNLKTFCGQARHTDGHMYVQTDTETGFIRCFHCFESDNKI